MRAQCQHVFHRGSSVRIHKAKRESLETLQKPVAVSAHFFRFKAGFVLYMNGASFERQYCAHLRVKLYDTIGRDTYLVS